MITRVNKPILLIKCTANRMCSFFFRPQSTQATQVRVRFAPSPTGKLHIGGLRTAFYNYLFARKHNGVFILRLEDTDQERLKIDSFENIIESLKWAKLEPDYSPHINKPDDLQQGAPWRQSQRLDIYNTYARKLLDSGHAYLCFCDEARLELLRRNSAKRLEKIGYDGKCKHLPKSTVDEYVQQGKSFVVRFKLDDKEVVYNDLTTGLHKSSPGKQEGDFIIIKSDKYPTYHFANVVDDHLMKITHVLRGQEWQLSTPKHILIYEAFGWKPPQFAHLPLICNNDGSKISKRQNDIDVLSYRQRGYLPETLLTYLSTIGGGSKVNLIDDDSFFAQFDRVLPNLVHNFDESKMNSKLVKLNQELLDNLNRRFLKSKLKSDSRRHELVEQLKQLLVEKFAADNLNEHYLNEKYLMAVLDWSMDRIYKLNELVDKPEHLYLWRDMSNLDLDALKKQNISRDQLLELVSSIRRFLTTTSSQPLNAAGLKSELTNIFKRLKAADSTKSKVNYWQLSRAIVTGNFEGPPVVDLFLLLGKDIVIYRLDMAIRVLSKTSD